MESITPQEVNAWLPKNKWQVDAATYSEPELDENARARVLGRLSGTFPVEDWRTNDAPKLIRQIAAMHISAWIYARQYAEDAEDVESYPGWLLRQAENLLLAVLEGDISIEGEDMIAESAASAVSGEPMFTTGDVW